MVLLSAAKAKFVISLSELHEIQKFGTAASKVVSQVITPKILEYAYVLKKNWAKEYFNAWHGSENEKETLQ